MNSTTLQRNLENAIALKQKVLNDTHTLEQVDKIIQLAVQQFKVGKALYWCGNGGSAADAQHLSAELSGRYYFDRPPLASEALHVNTSYVTAVANDYGYDKIYERMIEAIGKDGDILIGLSTSGNSPNVVKAIEKAKEMGIHTIAFTGQTGGKLREIADICIQIPSTDTPRIQECHMLIGHTICEEIESNIFPK